jgi:hypothetical protein
MNLFVTKKQLQAMTEGKSQSILNITYEELIRKLSSNWVNQYLTYETQLEAIYKGYQTRSAYASNYISDIIDKRTNLIVSEGLSITAKKEKTQKFINDFIDYNKLDGSKLIELVRISEMEGRILSILFPDTMRETDGTIETYIKVKNIRFRKTKYKLNIDPRDDEKIIKVEINNSLGELQSYNPDVFVYSHNGISLDEDPNPCIASILTNCEYADRVLYDLRKSNHLFGFPTPNIVTTDNIMQKQVKNDIDGKQWKPGSALIGPTLEYPQPPNSSEILKGEIALHMKIISSRTGIPVHWLGWTDLLSNRSTAMELRDFISTCIRDEKIRAREHMREIICKMMTMAVDRGIDGAVYDEDFEVDVPDVSIETVKALSETWLPLYDAEMISKFDFQNKIPGINPLKTNKQIEKDKQDNMDRYTANIQKPVHDENMNQDETNTEDQGADNGNV